MLKILLVDDSPVLRRIQARVLREAGLSSDALLEAGDGMEALAILESEPDVDLLLSDLNMPRMDGLALVRAVRRVWSPGRLPVVLVATERDEERARQGLHAGASAYVTKPFTAASLLAALAGMRSNSFRGVARRPERREAGRAGRILVGSTLRYPRRRA